MVQEAKEKNLEMISWNGVLKERRPNTPDVLEYFSVSLALVEFTGFPS